MPRGSGGSEREQAVRAAERLAIARDLHDELGQSLSALRLGLATLSMRHGHGRGELAQPLSELLQLADRSLRGLREVVARLRPTGLRQGLPAALQCLASEFVRQTGRACSCELAPGLRLDEERALQLYRIVQEALTNSARHAQAERVWITLQRQGPELVLGIRDDGIGFDPGAVSAGMGLRGMRERGRLLGARLHCDSRPGQGTRIELRLPLKLAMPLETRVA